MGHNYYQQPGGEDGFFLTELALLKQSGHEVSVLERHNDEIKPGIASRIAHAASLRFSKNSYEQTRALIQKFKPEVAHFHNTFFVMTPAVLYACRDEGVPVAVSLHNFRLMCINGLFLRDGKPCEDCLQGTRMGGIIHRCYRGSLVSSFLATDMINAHWRRGTWTKVVNRFLVATEFTRNKYIQAGIPAAKISVLPPFVDDLPKTGQVPGGYAFYAGRLSEEKGVDILIQAWRHVKDFPLYIAGQGPLQPYVENYIKEHGLTNVTLLGFKENKECLKLLARARFLIVPSVCYENFPRVIVEAYACGVPVLANAMGTMQEVVEDGHTGLLYAQNDPQDLARKARVMSTDDGMHALLSANARRVYDSRYTQSCHLERLVGVYEGMMAHA